MGKKNKKFSSFSELLGILGEDNTIELEKKGKKNKKSGAAMPKSTSEFPFKKDKKKDKENNEEGTSKSAMMVEVENIPIGQLRTEIMMSDDKIKRLRESIISSDDVEDTEKLKEELEMELYRYELMNDRMKEFRGELKDRMQERKDIIVREQIMLAKKELANLREKYGDEIIDKITA